MSDEDILKKGEALADIMIDQIKEKVGAVKEETEAALKELGRQAAQQKVKAAKARLEDNEAQAKVHEDNLDDIAAQAKGVASDAALESMDIVQENLKGFVGGLFGLLKAHIPF